MSTTRGFIGVNGVEYTKISEDLTPSNGSGTPQSLPGQNPVTFSFLYAPALGTSFSNTNTFVPICSFNLYDHYICEYLITAWNPNSDAQGTGDVGNAITQDGYFFFDSMGFDYASVFGNTNNLGITTYASFNVEQGVEVSAETSITGIGTTSYAISTANVVPSTVSDGTIHTIRINQIKSGYKIKGLITLI